MLGASPATEHSPRPNQDRGSAVAAWRAALPAGAFEEPPMGGQIRSVVKGLQHGLQLRCTSCGRARPSSTSVRRRGPIGGGRTHRRPEAVAGYLVVATTPTPRQGRGAKPGATGGSTTRRRSKTGSSPALRHTRDSLSPATADAHQAAPNSVTATGRLPGPLPHRTTVPSS